MKRTPEATVTIESLAQSGEGFARHEGRVILVRGTIPGDTVRVRLGSSGNAELVSFVERSALHVDPPCARADECGGCTWQHVPSEMQRDARLAQLQRALPNELRAFPVEFVAAPEAYRYRTRARIAWRTHGARVTLGFRARASHDLIDATDCVVMVAALEAALAPLREQLTHVPGAGEAGLALGRNGAPVVSLRPERVTGEAAYRVPEALVAHGFAGAALWSPGATVPVVAGDPRPVVTGGDGAPLWLAPGGFAQANDVLNATLANRVREASAASGSSVLELYAGAGNFSVLLARDATKVTAVESDREASAALVENARARGLSNVAVVHGDAASEVATRKADIVVLDPPRTGAREAAETLARRPPRRVVYVSCDPATLGRDLRALAQSMELKSLTAFEMFPQTPHLEVLAVLQRRRG